MTAGVLIMLQSNLRLRSVGPPARLISQMQRSCFRMDNESDAYEQQEEQIRAKTEAFIELLTKRGILEDKTIKDASVREMKRIKKRSSYHNTLMLLKNYRTIAWMIECFPDTIEEELDRPFARTDELLDHLDIEICLGNKKLESRLAGVQRTRLLLDRVNEALTVLKKKPGNGEKLYDLIYATYIESEVLTHEQLLYRLDMSSRQYYRLREQAVSVLSVRLWSAPAKETDCWLEVLTIVENMKS